MTQKKNFLFTVLFVVCTLLFACTACQDTGNVKSAEVTESTQTRVLIRVNEVEGKAVLYDVMSALKEQGELDFVSENSPYGQSLVRINGVENADDWSYYWASYTTDSENGSFAFTRDGVDWYYAAAGLSHLPVTAGEYYLFEYIENTYNG